MVVFEPFAVEQWFDEYELTATYNLAETCVASVSVNDLIKFGKEKNVEPLSFSQTLHYGAIRGSEQLRRNIAGLYGGKAAALVQPDNILVTPGAIMANFLLFYTLIGPGDHVICVHPTYSQLYAVPRSLGAVVDLWRLREENNFIPDVAELEALLKPNTKLIVINNPNNPTGATIPRTIIERLIDVASARGIIVMSDEVYRPLFHSLPSDDQESPPSILSMGYNKTIATGSLSKSFSLAGIRVGWIASRDLKIIEACAAARNYSTISVSQLDDQIAAYALSAQVVHNLLDRNMKLARHNLTIVEKFLEDWKSICSWVKPSAGTTAFIKLVDRGQPINDEMFCRTLQECTGVMFCPGSKCFGENEYFKGYIRIGYACETKVLEQGLGAVASFFKEHSLDFTS